MDDKDAMSKEEEKKVTDRINELYHKKEKEGLTPEEEAERKELHKKTWSSQTRMARKLPQNVPSEHKEEKDLEKINQFFQKDRGL